MTPQEISMFIYNLALVPIIFLSVLYLILTVVSILVREEKKIPGMKEADLPFVSVQVPSFNDPIAARCIEQCMKFDYPKDRYEIIIVDDSTNYDTQILLKRYADDNPDFIKFIHRDNRQGFKAGALMNAMPMTKGEIIVIFDADWIPKEDFLRKVVMPFADKKVAIVQTRQGFYNKDTNLITRFAAYTLMIYHGIMMPINNRINCVFFCGTAGALRRSAINDAGGWTLGSFTEDSDLSVRLLIKGYKTVYLESETPSEVPDTFESFIKQQMRWCYGNSRVFFDNFWGILSSRTLKLRQKFMIAFITLTNAGAPFVVIMTFFGLSGWFIGEPALFNWQDIIIMVTRFVFTAGFLATGFLMLYRYKALKEFGYFVLSSFSVGIVLAVANSFAFVKAAFNTDLNWSCTPKNDNENIKGIG